MILRVPVQAALLFALLPAVVLLIGGTAQAGDGWWGKLDEGEAVSLADIMAKPSDYRGRALTFFCIYHGRNTKQLFDPVRTPFNPRRYDNFAVWPDGAALWEERAFKRDLPFMYIPTTHSQRDLLLSLPMITRIEITGKIRAVLRGRPCIEVYSFRQTGHRVSKAIVKAVNWGDNYARMGTADGDQRAARQYRDALAPDLPPVYGMIVRKRLAGALRRLGHMEDADRVESGEILGGGSIPEPQPDAPGMPDPFAPLPSSSETGELPPEPMTDVGPPAAPELPGTPIGAAPPQAPGAFPPAAPPVPSAGMPAPRMRQPDAPATQRPTGDLPGVPYSPSTPDDFLPGERAGSGAPTPMPGMGPGRARPAPPPPSMAPAPARPRGAETPAPRSRVLRGIPPKRSPRLSGVK